MATKLMQIGDQRRPELGVIGVYRTKENFPYDKNHPNAQSDGDKYGKNPISPNDLDSYTKVGDLADITARIGPSSPGNLLQNKYTRDGNQYDQNDVAYP